MTVFAAGVFMGILQASGMSDAIANSLLTIIPENWSLFYGLIVALIMTDAVPEEIKQKMINGIPVKRIGQPEDIAYAMKFLASKEAGYITGQTIQVNGGMNM